MSTDGGAKLRAMVLAAGLGTRLRPLTLELPKPLVWLGDRPQIDHLLAELARGGVDRAVINTHHLARAFDDAWANRQPLAIARVFEANILGTAGGLANAADALGAGPVLVWNADIVASVDVAPLARAHAASGAEVTLVVGPNVLASGDGTLGMGANGTVVRLRAFRGPGEMYGGDYAGIAVVGPSLRSRLPASGCLVGDGLMPWLGEGHPIATFALASPFRDVGSIAAYLDANLAWLTERELTHWIADDACVAPRVAVLESVVAPGATVEGRGALRRVVVWPGARAEAPLEDAIVTPRGVVPVNRPE